MSFKSLNVKVLKKEELRKINAAVAPDCEPGQILQYIPGLGYVCGPHFCAWEIPVDRT